MHPTRRLLLTLCLGLALPALAADTATPEQLERGLVGSWRGALAYRDYQSNRRFELPMTVRIELGPDGATFTRLSRFDDGPATGFVHITTVSLFDASGATATHASFRRGRAVESWAESGRVLRHAGGEDWTLVYERRGTDGEAPADIRLTQTRRADTLTALKEVRLAEGGWQFRNETVLQRQP